jgi:hypothetical protein
MITRRQSPPPGSFCGGPHHGFWKSAITRRQCPPPGFFLPWATSRFLQNAETVMWVAHGKTSQEAVNNRRQVLPQANHAFTETMMWPTAKRARRWTLAPGIHDSSETVLWPPVNSAGRLGVPGGGQWHMVYTILAKPCCGPW